MWIEGIHREIHTYIRVHSHISINDQMLHAHKNECVQHIVLFDFNIWAEYNRTLWIWKLNSHTRNLSAFDVNNLYKFWWDWNIHNKFWINLKCTLDYYQHLSWWHMQLNSKEKSSDFFYRTDLLLIWQFMYACTCTQMCWMSQFFAAIASLIKLDYGMHIQLLGNG